MQLFIFSETYKSLQDALDDKGLIPLGAEFDIGDLHATNGGNLTTGELLIASMGLLNFDDLEPMILAVLDGGKLSFLADIVGRTTKRQGVAVERDGVMTELLLSDSPKKRNIFYRAQCEHHRAHPLNDTTSIGCFRLAPVVVTVRYVNCTG